MRPERRGCFPRGRPGIDSERRQPVDKLGPEVQGEKNGCFYDVEHHAIALISPKLGGVTVVKGTSRVREEEVNTYGDYSASQIARARGDKEGTNVCGWCCGGGRIEDHFCTRCDGSGMLADGAPNWHHDYSTLGAETGRISLADDPESGVDLDALDP